MNSHLGNGLDLPSDGWSRRRFLTTSALGVAAVASAGFLAACSSDTTSSTKTTGATGKPKKGGTLRVGASGGASSDTLDPQAWNTVPDQLRAQQLFDPLVWMNNEGTPTLVLAESIEPNADGTEWTITIKPGVVTHAGKDFTADDVLFSVKRVVENGYAGPALSSIDLKKSRVVDKTTAVLAFSKPFGPLVDVLSGSYYYMVPRGFDPKKPDGTGPFKFQSFTPGQESTFVRNENYWDAGLPYLDKIVTININDESSQVNGLQSGQVDVINGLSASSVAALKGGGYVVNVNESGNWAPFTQNASTKPFSDVRVRQAFRLIPDRPQMLEQVFGGYGKIGNDVFSPFDPGYPSGLAQREQDIPQAKALLKAAGYEDLTVKLTAAPATAGQMALAQVFATQAKAAGVTVQIDQQTVTNFYANAYLKSPFSMDYGTNQMYMTNAAALMVGDAAPFNANHFDDPEYNQLHATAAATIDDAKRQALIGQMAEIDYERGGYIVPVFSPTIEASSASVGGIKKSVTGIGPGNGDFKRFWMA